MKIILKNAFRIAVFVIGALALVGVIFLYRVSNPTIGFYAQMALSVLAMLYAIFFNKISTRIHITLVGLAMIPAAFVLFLFVYGNTSNADFTEDVAIVLGAGVNGERVSRPLAHRLYAAIDYWQQNPDAYIIVCGGLGNRATITEAEAMSRFLIARGIPQEKILLEEMSTSTLENLMFAKEILEDHFPDGFRAVLITNDFHIYRGVQMAESIGLEVTRAGAHTDWYSLAVNYIREMLAVMHMWVLG